MTHKTIVWTGDNQVELSHFIGHENFWHKDGDVLIQHNGENLIVKKGSTLIKSAEGKLYLPLSQSHKKGEPCAYSDELEKALKLIRRRMDERFAGTISGDQEQVLKALELIEFWAMPLQNGAESLGFHDYFGLFVASSFDTPQCKESWEVGFLKAHAVDTEGLKTSAAHAEKLIAKRQL